MVIAQGLLGILAFIALCWVFSEHRRFVHWRQVALGVVVQLCCALVILKVPFVQAVFMKVGLGFQCLREATLTATTFVFGFVGGGTMPFETTPLGNTFSLAFQALPMIFVVSALSMLLFYWRVLPALVHLFSGFFRRTLGVGGALGVLSAGKIFLGQAEAPLLILPYLKNISRSELFMVMTLGMATTSATIITFYGILVEPVVSNPMSHLLAAAIITIPGAITLCRVLVPERSDITEGAFVMPYTFMSSTDAIARGTQEGIRLYINILAMLIVFVALVTMVNQGLNLLPDVMGAPLSMQRILGVIMAPVAWLMGIPWAEAMVAGGLLGIKTVLNEIFAFTDLGRLTHGELSPTSSVIMTYALCGFANISSVGIVIGGLGSLVPERREEIVGLGFWAVFVGTLATCLSGAMVGLIFRVGELF